MTDLEKAKTLLHQAGATCVLCRGDSVISDTRRGIRPLLELLDSGKDFSDYSAADKVVGKAAAHIYCLLGIRQLYARTVSQPALDLLTENGVDIRWDNTVPAIQNRTQTGLCPMESAVWTISDHNKAVQALRFTLAELIKGHTI